VNRPKAASGFVVSAEMMVIAVVLVLGLIAGWVKLRDQSLAEIADTIGAVDAYLLGSAALFQTGGTRWIVDEEVVDPPVTGPVTENWVNEDDSTQSFVTVEVQTSTPDGDIYEMKDGVLVYSTPAGE
jgi:hypothetical protein